MDQERVLDLFVFPEKLSNLYSISYTVLCLESITTSLTDGLKIIVNAAYLMIFYL